MRKMFLDIETLPASEEYHETLRMLETKRSKKKGDLSDGKLDFEQSLLKTSFDGSFGRILCIGYALDNDRVECLCDEKDEAGILRKFWDIARNVDLFIGHNIIDFDMRFIYQRSIINKVIPSKDLGFARYRNFPMFDTMKEWSKWSMTNIGLEHIALALGIPSPKDGIDGSQVYDFYKAGKTDEIAEYCKRDVETTRLVYKRMIFEN
jgi:3'-5' exonuclease